MGFVGGGTGTWEDLCSYPDLYPIELVRLPFVAMSSYTYILGASPRGVSSIRPSFFGFRCALSLCCASAPTVSPLLLHSLWPYGSRRLDMPDLGSPVAGVRENWRRKHLRGLGG